jgi:hypothetical protein
VNRTPWVLLQAAGLVALLSLFAGCGSIHDEFVGLRVQDECGGEWPVCSTTVGCMLGDRSYVDARFPGTHKVSVQVFEPSKVTASFYLYEVAGAGELTVVNFWEDGCRARTRLEVAGKVFVGEAEKKGYVTRSAELSGVGDHLIEVESDARARYLMKIDVLPLRLQEAGSQ